MVNGAVLVAWDLRASSSYSISLPVGRKAFYAHVREHELNVGVEEGLYYSTLTLLRTET